MRGSFLSSCGIQESKSGHPPWQKVPIPTQSSFQCLKCYLKLHLLPRNINSHHLYIRLAGFILRLNRQHDDISKGNTHFHLQRHLGTLELRILFLSTTVFFRINPKLRLGSLENERLIVFSLWKLCNYMTRLPVSQVLICLSLWTVEKPLLSHLCVDQSLGITPGCEHLVPQLAHPASFPYILISTFLWTREMWSSNLTTFSSHILIGR